MKFVGKKIGLDITKAKSVNDPINLNNRRDTELLNEARYKIILRKGTAIMQKNATDSSPFNKIVKDVSK